MQWAAFTELSLQNLYGIMKLRQKVFVVEQVCAYLDADGLDFSAMHLMYGDSDTGERVEGYLRLIPPGNVAGYPEAAAIGRLVVDEKMRGYGIASKLMHEGIAYAAKKYPGSVLHVSAQVYLKRFYEYLGFTAVTEVYDEDGIDHIGMQLFPKEG